MKVEPHDDGVVTLSFDRPDALNAMNWDLIEGAYRAFVEVSASAQTRAIVLTGEGRSFSAGGDVVWFDALLQESETKFRDTISRFMEEIANPLSLAISESRVPVVSAINGPCAGGAVGVALSADVTIMGKSAFFLVPQVAQLGIIPDLGATWVLARRLGRARALGAMLLGERIDADQAERWGLAWKVVPDADLVTEAKALAAKLGQLPADAIRATRTLVDDAETSTYAEGLAAERTQQRRFLTSDFSRTAMAMFAAKAAKK